MAGMMDKRVKASSLLETIVALMVIVLIFGIAMTIYGNVLKNSTSPAELKASQRLKEIAWETKRHKSYFDASYTEEGIEIEKTVSKYQGKEGIILLELKAIAPDSRKLAEYKELISEDAEN